MPGGKNNIRPEDGKQFSKDYQPAKKWTEKKALQLGEELIAWLNEKDENMFFEEFLYLNNDYYETLITYLRGEFSSFSQLIEKAKKIQEVKLVKFGVFDKLNAQMTKFTLINNHGYKERTEVNQNVKNNDIKITVRNAKEKKQVDDFLDKID
jgi:hypothetical protein